MMRRQSRSTGRRQRDPEAIEFAREQRSQANEFAELVWQLLRNRRCRNQKFRREHPIPPYTADFCCVALKLIVEVDGEYHETDQGRAHDRRRDQYLTEKGYVVLRLAGYEVLRDPAAARRQIEDFIDQRIAPLGPLTSIPSPPARDPQ